MRSVSKRTHKSLSFSANDRLRRLIDERAAALGMNRTQYIRHIVVEDLTKGGALVVKELVDEAPPRSGEKHLRVKKLLEELLEEEEETARPGVRKPPRRRSQG